MCQQAERRKKVVVYRRGSGVQPFEYMAADEGRAEEGVKLELDGIGGDGWRGPGTLENRFWCWWACNCG